MNLPKVQKTWLYATILNDLTGTNVGNAKSMVIKWKNQRKAWGHVLAGSGNGTTGAMDGVDRVLAITDFQDFSNGNWIVMTQPGSGAQDLIFYNNFGQPNWGFTHSPAGLFTGGSSSTLPTASDSTGNLYTGIGGGLFFGNGSDGGSDPQFICNMWASSDLSCVRSSFWLGGNPFGMIWYDAAEDPTTGWAHPNYALVDKAGNGVTANQHIGWFQNLVQHSEITGLGPFIARGPSGLMHLHMTAEAGADTTYLSNNGFRTKNKISGFYRMPDAPPGLYEIISNADGGWHGRVFDAWLVGGSDNGGATFATGSTVPLDGSKQFAIIGDVMLPWNGTAFRTT